MGIPEMDEYWSALTTKINNNQATKEENKIYKLLHKTFVLLSQNPRHPGLNSHEIDELTARTGIKIFQSYCENNKPAAIRLYWAYGPEKDYITILGVEPHPNNSKSNAYTKIKLSKRVILFKPTSSSIVDI